MDRAIIDIPRVMLLATTCDWDIDWRGQSAGSGSNSEQIVYNRQPRFIGSPTITLLPEMIPHWRALRARVQGRVGVWRVPMIDPLGFEQSRGAWVADWAAYLSGYYVEDRPQILCAEAADAGATTLLVDERMASAPVGIGAYLSHDDWPFVVTDRVQEGVYARLSVQMLRRPIALGAAIDLEARGVFIGSSDTMGLPEYGLGRTSGPKLDFVEWITRT
jgi:hypothetical protein